MNIYYDKDCDLSIIQGKKVTVVGYGSQGHAHANNLKDSGVDVTVALREGSASAAKAEAAGLAVKNTADAIREADVVMILTPDEFQRNLYENEIEPNIKQGAAMAFAHGFAIHFNQVVPRADLDVICATMVVTADDEAEMKRVVAAARKLTRPPPRIISYVMTTAGPEPLAEIAHEPDREHYVEKQVRPVAEPVLATLGLDFARVIGDDRQLGLF